MGEWTLAATAAFGLEAVVARELKELGYHETRVENGRVFFTGGPADVARANLWLRASDRVLVKLGAFPAPTFDALFEQTLALPWSDWLPEDAAFPVAGKAVRSTLMSVPDCQAIVKKAIVENLRRRYRRDWFPETGPVYPITVSVLKDVATISLDTTGMGLHKRGYRRKAGEAPLKETLAAAMLLLARWTPQLPLVDPCCGSGTFPIEAALLARRIAPGLRRTFLAEAWPQVPAGLWAEERRAAEARIDRDLKLDLCGFDLDPEAIALSAEHAREAGVANDIRWETRPLHELSLPAGPGMVICNPPYGERLGEVKAVERLYRELGELYRTSPGWAFHVLSAHPHFERFFRRRANRARKLYNGRLECQFLSFPSSQLVPDMV